MTTPTLRRDRGSNPVGGVKVYSLPSVGESGERRHIELGVKGVGAVVEEAYESLVEGVIELGSEFEEI